jgi:hypothetical protein
MKLTIKCIFILSFLLIATSGWCALLVQVAPAKSTGSKAIIKLSLQNTFSQRIDLVRAAVFLTDEQGKVVGQATRQIIGGGKNNPPLDPAGKAVYYFLVPAAKPFTKTKVLISRIILENNEIVDPVKQSQISQN